MAEEEQDLAREREPEPEIAPIGWDVRHEPTVRAWRSGQV
jgi:hypothetical protein